LQCNGARSGFLLGHIRFYDGGVRGEDVNLRKARSV
jgi:hypothetical protein